MLEQRCLLAVNALDVLPLFAVEGKAIVPPPELLIGTFQDPENSLNLGGGLILNLGSYEATLNWGDGFTSSTDSGTLSIRDTDLDGVLEVYATDLSRVYNDVGLYTLTLGVTDVTPGSVSDPFDSAIDTGVATVTDAPFSVTTISPVVVDQGTLFNDMLLTFLSEAPFDTASEFSATINWGDGTPLSVGSITKTAQTSNASFFRLNGSHTYTTPGNYSITVTLNGEGGPAVTATVPATVNDAQIRDVTGLPFTATEGQQFGAVLATFVDTNKVSSRASDFSATVNWDDGTPLDSATFIVSRGFNASGQPIYGVVGLHTYTSASGSPYSATVTISSTASGVVGTAIATGTIRDAALRNFAPITFNTTEGQAFSQPIATFLDTNRFATTADYPAGSVQVDWDADGTFDSNATVAVVSSGTSGVVFQVVGSNTYQTPGTYFPVVRIAPPAGSTLSGSTTVNVADAALTATGRTINVTEGQSFTQVIATFVDADGSSTASELQASVFWGDGTSDTTAGSNVQIVNVSDGNPANGTEYQIRGTHTYSNNQNYSINIVVNSIFGSSATTSSTAVVADAPILNLNVPAFERPAGQPFGGFVLATFQSGDPTDPASEFSATVNWGDGSPVEPASTINRRTVTVGGNVSVFFDVIAPTHTYLSRGVYTVTVTVQGDNNGSTATASGRATATKLPVVGFANNLAAVEGQTKTFTVAQFSNPVDDPTVTERFQAQIDFNGDGIIDFTATTLPGGGITEAFGIYTVTATYQYANPGIFDVDVFIREIDPTSPVPLPTTKLESTATVQDAPLALQAQTITAVEGMPFTNKVVAVLTDADLTGGTFQATINWGDGSPASTGTVVATGTPGVYNVLGSHAYPTLGIFSPVRVTVQSTGVIGVTPSTATTNSTAIVSDAALRASGVFIIDDRDGDPLVEGKSFSVVVATFVDENPNGTAADKFASISWGDGSSSPGTIVRVDNPATPGVEFEVRGSHTYNSFGLYNLVVSINSFGGSSATANSQALVQDAPIDVTGIASLATQENVPFIGTVATFVDANIFSSASDFAANIVAPGGTVSGVSIVQTGLGTFAVNATLEYDDPGTYSLIVSVNSSKPGGTASDSATSQILVFDAPIINVQGRTFSRDEGAPFQLVVATFDDGIGNEAGDYSATINWGDGSPVEPAVNIVYNATAGVYEVLGDHTYRFENNPGPYVVTVTINSLATPPTASKTATTIATVLDAPLSDAATQPTLPTFVEGVAQANFDLYAFTSANPFDTASHFTASIQWGDGTSSIGTVRQDGSRFVVSATKSYASAEAGPYTVNIVVADTFGAFVSTVTEQRTITVRDAAILNLAALNISGVEGQNSNFTVATFRSENPNAPASNYEAIINWGDGTSTTMGAITKNTTTGVFTVTGTRTYADTGIYPVSVTVRETDGSPSVTAGSTATINDAPLVPLGAGRIFTATEGNSTGMQMLAVFVSGSLTERVDDDPSDFSATVMWGDGSSSASSGADVSIVKLSTGVFAVMGKHVYLDPGTFPLGITVNSLETPGATSLTINSTINSAFQTRFVVVDAAMTAKAETIRINGLLAGVNTGLVRVGTFFDADPTVTDPNAEYEATINWGDGTSSMGVVIRDLATGAWNVFGNHTYANPGTYQVTTLVKSKKGPSQVLLGPGTGVFAFAEVLPRV